MSEELIQRNLIEAPEKMGDWNFYNIGATTLKALKGAKIIPDKDYEAYEGKKPDALIVKKPIIIGFAGTILILNGKFSINGDRGILVPKNGRQDLDFDYMKFTLEPIFRELAKGRKGDNGEDEFTKLYPSMLSDIMVPIPVDGKGNISLLLQKEIAQKFISVQNSQKEIIEKLDALISKKISM